MITNLKRDRLSKMGDRHRHGCRDESDSSEEGCRSDSDESYFTSSLPSDAIPIKGSCCGDDHHDDIKYGHTKYSSKGGKQTAVGINVKVMISPLTRLTTVDNISDCGLVGVTIRRRNNVITFSWEAFQGQLAGNGITYLTMNQTFSHLPFTKMQYPIRIKHNGKAKLGYIEIDPKSAQQIKIYLSFDDPVCETQMNDSIFVAGSCIQWITCQK